MKEWRMVLVVGACFMCCVPLACGLFSKAVIKGTLDVTLAACLAELPGADEAAAKAACKYADELAPEVRAVLQAKGRGLVKLGDAGK